MSQPKTASRTYSGLQAFDEINGASFDQLTQKFLADFVTVVGVEGVGQSACSTLISEVLDIVSEHSLAEKCFAMYPLYPKKRFADICIADTGIGIWESYKRHGMFSPESHAEALELALIKHYSTKNYEGNRGFGIKHSQKVVNDLFDGTFLIQTGNALIVKSKKHDAVSFELKESVQFFGTLVCERINLAVPFNHADFYRIFD